MIRRFLGALALACALPASALAQNVTAPGGAYIPAQAIVFGPKDSAAIFVDATHGLPVNCITGCPSASTNYALETGGNLAALVANTTSLLKSTGGTVGLVAGSAVVGKFGLQVAGADVATTNPVTVAGGVADGVAPVNPAIHIAGVDGGGLKRTLSTDTSGKLNVNVNGTVPVSGNATSGTTLPTTGLAPMLRATSAQPTAVTDGQSVNGQADLSGRGIINLGGVPQNQIVSGPVTLTTTTETALIPAAAGKRHGLFFLGIDNADTADHYFIVRMQSGSAFQAVRVRVKAGTSKEVTFDAGLWASGANNNLTVQMDAASTTTGPVVYAQGFDTSA